MAQLGSSRAVGLTLLLVLVAFNLMSGEKKIERRIERLYSLEDPRFAHELGVLLGPAFVEGNCHQVLRNGEEIFPAMLAAIRSGKTSINFETNIFWSGAIGQEFANALAERSRRGVKVHVLLDWVGSAKVERHLVDKMKAAGVQIRKFHPPHWSHLGRLNNRTHRKLLVVDGRVAFTGGVGIAPQWTGHAQDPEHWRDTHFQVEGPVVAQYQPTMYHCKVMVVDGILVSVGSTNFDNRSFRLNDEATLNIIDADFGRQQTAIFDTDLAESRVVDYAQWKDRPLRERIAERFAALIDTQL